MIGEEREHDRARGRRRALGGRLNVVATVAEPKLRPSDPVERAKTARDSYSYLHLPMVAGIVAPRPAAR
jgi:hypothetical protein